MNIQSQKLHLLDSASNHSYTVSTAATGAGQEEGSGKTPLGLHVIQEKIGDGAHPYAIFSSREDTGKIAVANDGTASITSRILRLSGVEENYNRGKNLDGRVVDSYDRYIYIHGTNDINNLGKPVSQGCIRMNPEDIIQIFDQVAEKTPVYIYQA